MYRKVEDFNEASIAVMYIEFRPALLPEHFNMSDQKNLRIFAIVNEIDILDISTPLCLGSKVPGPGKILNNLISATFCNKLPGKRIQHKGFTPGGREQHQNTGNKTTLVFQRISAEPGIKEQTL